MTTTGHDAALTFPPGTLAHDLDQLRRAWLDLLACLLLPIAAAAGRASRRFGWWLIDPRTPRRLVEGCECSILLGMTAAILVVAFVGSVR